MNQAAPWWVIPGLASGILATFAGSLAASFIWGNDTLRTTMATAAVNLVFGVGGYYFGSSAGSQKKDDVIAKAMPVGGSV